MGVTHTHRADQLETPPSSKYLLAPLHIPGCPPHIVRTAALTAATFRSEFLELCCSLGILRCSLGILRWRLRGAATARRILVVVELVLAAQLCECDGGHLFEHVLIGFTKVDREASECQEKRGDDISMNYAQPRVATVGVRRGAVWFAADG